MHYVLGFVLNILNILFHWILTASQQSRKKICRKTVKSIHTHNENTLRKKEREIEVIFEAIMTETFPKLMSDTKLQNKKDKRIENRINANKTTVEAIIFKLQKIKDKVPNLERSLRKKNNTAYRGAKIKLSYQQLLLRNHQARNEWVK